MERLECKACKQTLCLLGPIDFEGNNGGVVGMNVKTRYDKLSERRYKQCPSCGRRNALAEIRLHGGPLLLKVDRILP